FGKRLEDLIGKRWHPIAVMEDVPHIEAKLAALSPSNPVVTIENRVYDGQGEIHWMEFVNRAFFDADGNITHIQAVGRDISVRKEAEIALAINAQLEEKVAQRTAELQRANQELENFTYAASHDMRAPLGRINNFSALLRQRYIGHLDEEGRLFLDLIHQNASRLYQLVDDLLAHARMGTEKLEMASIDLEATVQVLVHERADDIQRLGAQVRIDVAPGMQAPAHALVLNQVLRNLLDNALKYSAMAKPPRIEIGAGPSESVCRVWVRDNGIGIDPAYHQRIFEIFRRLHTYSEFPGSGVGLALVKKAVERMNGRVWVESEPGVGATFFLEWPAPGPMPMAI
ncbi:MAG TPA: ATP-binding protein, partial [Rhodocyclaceae bacterium]|nr:ATP-binding protein [Rhodocyclaceae bacterium]